MKAVELVACSDRRMVVSTVAATAAKWVALMVLSLDRSMADHSGPRKVVRKVASMVLQRAEQMDQMMVGS